MAKSTLPDSYEGYIESTRENIAELSQWSVVNESGQNAGAVFAAENGYRTVQFTSYSEDDYVRYIMPYEQIAGKTLAIGLIGVAVSGSIVDWRFRMRLRRAGDIYEVLFNGRSKSHSNAVLYTPGQIVLVEVPVYDDVVRATIEFYPGTDGDVSFAGGIHAKLTEPFLFDTAAPVVNRIQFGRVLKEYMPGTMGPGRQAIYFAKSTVNGQDYVEMFVAANNGQMLPVVSPTAEYATTQYNNSYTAQHIRNTQGVYELQRANQVTALCLSNLRIQEDGQGLNILRDVRMITQAFSIDYVAICGNTIDSGVGAAAALALLKQAAEILGEIEIPVFFALGPMDTEALTARDWWNEILRHTKLPITAAAPDGNYYGDFPEIHHRAVVMAVDNAWFRAALNVPDGWTVNVISAAAVTANAQCILSGGTADAFSRGRITTVNACPVRLSPIAPSRNETDKALSANLVIARPTGGSVIKIGVGEGYEW